MNIVEDIVTLGFEVEIHSAKVKVSLVLKTKVNQVNP